MASIYDSSFNTDSLNERAPHFKLKNTASLLGHYWLIL